MKKITLQDIFDAAWKEFIVDDKPPSVNFDDEYEDEMYDDFQLNPKFSCAYTSEDGGHCAIGLVCHKFLDGDYEDCHAGTIIQDFPSKFDNSVNPSQLIEIQKALHDDLVDLSTGKWILTKEERKQSYIKTAKRFNLTVPSIE